MSYLEDTFDWQDVEAIDRWLDEYSGVDYQKQSLAQDWARLAKVIEELGEAIQAFIGLTGQNPRKGVTHTQGEVLDELADVVFTGVLCMQHFTKDTSEVRQILRHKLAKIATRVSSLSGTHSDLSRAAQFRETGVWPPEPGHVAGVRPPDSEHGLHP